MRLLRLRMPEEPFIAVVRAAGERHKAGIRFVDQLAASVLWPQAEI